MRKYIIVILSAVLFFGCQEQAPVVLEYSPDFGPPETLITVQGENFETINTLNFDDGVPADFNTSYGTDKVLLFRVPEDAPLGDNNIVIGTDGGEIEIPFRVTLEAPSVLGFSPSGAAIGSEVTILGENFYEPLIVLFEDSIAADIKFMSEDSLIVIVPENASKGFIKVKANGGDASTNKNFFPTNDILINDFDGNGAHADISKWFFYGSINENSMTAIQNSDPEPIDGNYMKLSSSDSPPTWIGGTEHPSGNPVEFDVYPITSDLGDTYVEMDVNNNGFNETKITIILKQRSGSINDFSETISIDGSGWEKISLPLSRFTDINNLTIDPADIKVVKIHIVNPENSTEDMEVNIDNLKFVEVL